MKILVVASLTKSLINFRRTLLEEIVASGDHEVVACAPEADPNYVDELARIGVRFEQIPLSRASKNPFADLRTLVSIWLLMRREKPDLAIAYTQKPIIYTGLASRLVAGVRFHVIQSGLGFAFSEENKSDALKAIVARLYRAGIARAGAIFVFNGDDEAMMRDHDMLRAHHSVIQVAGSGVDPEHFSASASPQGAPVFLMVARLLRDKGPFEFVEAATRLKAEYPQARFQILGPLDANPTSVSMADIDAWRRDGVVEYLGETEDVRPYLAAASVFVAPSYHREGLPRSILEAMATGRAIVTTDMPGCRETVATGENGFAVAPRDPNALAEAMRRFIEDPALATKMGAASRKLAETRFSVRNVNDVILRAIGLRGDDAVPVLASPAPVKRALDAGLSAIALVALSPVIAFVFGATRLKMGAPALFRQERGGLGGSTFCMIKFRSMTDERGPDGELLPDEVRLTAFGRFLRRSRLDELPELWNILKGDMSFVGPRPLLPDSPINKGVAGQERLSVRPGLTGWAQVNGNALLSLEDKAALDAYYVRKRNLLFDLKIVLRTIAVVFVGERIGRRELKSAAETSESPSS